MKRTLALVTGLLGALLITAPVSAGPPTGTTFLLGAPAAGSVVDVRVTVHTAAPVVAYEYAIQNECTFPKKTATLQHDDIVYWTFVEGGDPAATMRSASMMSAPSAMRPRSRSSGPARGRAGPESVTNWPMLTMQRVIVRRLPSQVSRSKPGAPGSC